MVVCQGNKEENAGVSIIMYPLLMTVITSNNYYVLTSYTMSCDQQFVFVYEHIFVCLQLQVLLMLLGDLRSFVQGE